MNLYTKHDSESVHGDGVIYIEFADEVPTRQASVFGNIWVRGDAEHWNKLTDRYYSEFEFEASEHITSERFERIWAEALSREQSSRGPTAVEEP